MKRIFIATRRTKETNVGLLPAASGLLIESINDGPGSSRGPSPRLLLSKVEGFVRYQQSGSDKRRSRSAGSHDAGTRVGSWRQHQGEALILRLSLVAGPAGS